MIKKLKIENYGKFSLQENSYYYNSNSASTSRTKLIVDFDFNLKDNEDINIQVFCGNNGSGKSTVLKFIYDYIAGHRTSGRILDSGSILDCNNNVVSSEKFRAHEAKNIYGYENLKSNSWIPKGTNSSTNYKINHYIRDSPYITDRKTLEDLNLFITSMGYGSSLHIGYNLQIIEQALNSGFTNGTEKRIGFTDEEFPKTIKKIFKKQLYSCDNFSEIIAVLQDKYYSFIKEKFDSTIIQTYLFKDVSVKNKDSGDDMQIDINNSSYYWILLFLYSTLEFNINKQRPNVCSMTGFYQIFNKIKGKVSNGISYFGGDSWEIEFLYLLGKLNDIQKSKKNPIFYFQYRYNRYNKSLAWQELSEGERNMLHYFWNIFSQIQSGKCNILLIDEPEKSLHPRWEQEYIGLLKQVISGRLFSVNQGKSRSDEGYTTVQIFIATHSTFIPTDIDSKNIHKLYTKPVSLLHSNKLGYKDDLTYYRENNLLYSSNSYQKSLIGDTRVNIEKIIYKLNKRLDEEFPSSYGASQSEIDAYLFDLDIVSGAESSKLLEELIAWVESGKRKHIRSSSKHPWFQNINSKIELIDKIHTTFEKSNNIAAKYLLYKLDA